MHSLTNLLTHTIFSTKGRVALITDDIRDDLFAYKGGVIRELDGSALEINGMPDHAHLLVRLPSRVSVAEALRVLKANSTRWVHERWPERKRFGWQTGYAAFSVSQSNATAVQKYIAEQQQHHEKQSFQDELRAYLIKNGIEFDERYIWE